MLGNDSRLHVLAWRIKYIFSAKLYLFLSRQGFLSQNPGHSVQNSNRGDNSDKSENSLMSASNSDYINSNEVNESTTPLSCQTRFVLMQASLPHFVHLDQWSLLDHLLLMVNLLHTIQVIPVQGGNCVSLQYVNVVSEIKRSYWESTIRALGATLRHEWQQPPSPHRTHPSSLMTATVGSRNTHTHTSVPTESVNHWRTTPLWD